MSRRRFVIVGCTLVLAGAFLWIGWWWKMKLGKQDCRDVIIAILKRRLDYVKHHPKGLQLFADEYHGMMDWYVKDRLVKCALFLPVYGLFDGWLMGSSYREGYLGFTEPLVTRYLLSVNFFERATGEPDYSKELNYQSGGLKAGLICGNPWANLQAPSQNNTG